MRKYGPLHAHLTKRDGRPEILGFEEIEAIIGAELPPSAHKRSSFWANDYAGHHPHARAWLGAGYRVAYVSPEDGLVRFERLH
ncbi:MAG: hypothetical protein AB7O04_13235 [Hyphomonadaceae bacterium]